MKTLSIYTVTKNGEPLSFEEKLQLLKKINRENKKELQFHCCAENWMNREELKLLSKLRKRRWNLRRQFKRSGQGGKYTVKIVREEGTWKLKIKKRK